MSKKLKYQIIVHKQMSIYAEKKNFLSYEKLKQNLTAVAIYQLKKWKLF